jgi:aspartyl-tRNA(Asn)/glutamyl-tRNA(Gln) amidotransferase subunit A
MPVATEAILDLTIRELADAYRSGRLSAQAVTELYLQRSLTSSARGEAVYSLVTADRARREAAEADERLASGRSLGPLDGIPLALKDNLGLAGEVTTAGSLALAGNPTETGDAELVRRLRAAGAVILGRTVMTELAFTALGINPNQGTPVNTLDKLRVPGGSSSGAAVAVARRLAPLAVGSDTGGSIRIPAAFNGLVGLKPTNGSLPLRGAVPLAPTLDTFGPLARSVDDAELLWQALSGRNEERPEPGPLRVLVPNTIMLDDLDGAVRTALDSTCKQLRSLGFSVEEREEPVLTELRALYGRYGSFAGHEAYELYGELLRREGKRMDPRLVNGVLAYEQREPGLRGQLVSERARLVQEFGQATREFDLLLSPTVPSLPPLLADLTSPEASDAVEELVLRNTQLLNLLGVPALNLPAGALDPDTARPLPIGMTLSAKAGQEALLFAVGARLEGRGS